MNETTDAKILLVVKDQQRKTRYIAMMDELGADCCVVSSLQEAITHASEEPHCGVVFDMPLMIRASESLKTGVDDLLSGLPSAYLNIHTSTGGIRMLPRGTQSSTCSSIDQFVEVCAGFPPKKIFSRTRKPIHLNVLLDRDPEFAGPEETVCIDISVGGCFLFCVRKDITVDCTVWLKLPDSVCEYPVKCVVCWVRKWGTTHNIPGIGLRFENISDELKKTIGDMK
jgi:hypothetical protein